MGDCMEMTECRKAFEEWVRANTVCLDSRWGVDPFMTWQAAWDARFPDHDHVAIPVTADEAALMVLLGTDWLNRNAPERLRERESVEESGWVIELAASEPCSPQYWAGSSLWVPEHLKAIRFSRKQDAQ